MKYKVEILPSAWEDLKTIEDWYVINFDVQTAIKVSDHILDGIEDWKSSRIPVQEHLMNG